MNVKTVFVKSRILRAEHNGDREYDKNGNNTAKVCNGERLEYVYDAFGKLKRYITNDDIARYAYNSSGIRTLKLVDGTTTKYILNGGDVVGEICDGETTTYLRGINLICTDEYYYVFDAHGDVVNLTDANGNTVKSYIYDAFGVEKAIDDNDTNPFRYCGEYWDSETETYYLRARYYDPNLGRFSSEDPARAGLNWYTYCVNSPIMLVDPTGQVEVGLRSYSESHGAIVDWDDSNKCAYVYYNGKKFSIASTSDNNRNGRIYIDSTILDDFFGWNQSYNLIGSSLPTKGIPNSSQKLFNPDGSLKQERWYGSNGNAFKDRDYNHPGDHPFPHDHDWKNGKRQTWKPVDNNDRNDTNNNNNDDSNDNSNNTNNVLKIVGTGVAMGVGSYALYRVVRMLPSLLPPLWLTIPANALCP